jgi:hypothetical protein
MYVYDIKQWKFSNFMFVHVIKTPLVFYCFWYNNSIVIIMIIIIIITAIVVSYCWFQFGDLIEFIYVYFWDDDECLIPALWDLFKVREWNNEQLSDP